MDGTTGISKQKIMKASNKIFSCILFLLLLTATVSCNRNQVYEHFSQLKEAKWNRSDTLSFTVDTLRSLTGRYNIYMELTNNVNYPYRDIWLSIASNVHDSSEYDMQRNLYILADNRGRWQGKGFGSLYQVSFPLYENISLKDKRPITIKISHLMSDSILSGIERVGIRIVKSEIKSN